MHTNTPAAHENIAADLVRRGLPIDYAQRAAAEIADHHRDLVSELRSAGFEETAADDEASRRLGDPRTLVKKTVREYQRRHWCGRWPLVTFLFGPLLALMAAWTGTILVLFAAGYTLEAVGFKHVADQMISTGELIGAWSAIGWFVFILPAGVLLLFSRLATRAGLGSAWIVLAAIVLALNVGTMQWGFVSSQMPNGIRNSETGQTVPADQFVVSTPLWVFFSSVAHAFKFLTRSPQQLGQFLLPVVVAAIAIWRNRRWMQRCQRELVSTC